METAIWIKGILSKYCKDCDCLTNKGQCIAKDCSIRDGEMT